MVEVRGCRPVQTWNKSELVMCLYSRLCQYDFHIRCRVMLNGPQVVPVEE